MVRQWDVGTEVEGCVADDELGDLYISEENVAIWKYGAEPTEPATTASRVAVDRTIAAGGHIRPDAEGLTIVYQPGGTGYLIASSQAASDTLNSYLVYERQGANAFIRRFRVTNGATATDAVGPMASTPWRRISDPRSPKACSCVRTTTTLHREAAGTRTSSSFRWSESWVCPTSRLRTNRRTPSSASSATASSV